MRSVGAEVRVCDGTAMRVDQKRREKKKNKNRKKKKKKKGCSCDDAGILARNLSDLPDLSLACILDLLSIPDLSAFATVCTSWRSVFFTFDKISLRSRPPLLALPILNPDRTLTCRLKKPSPDPPSITTFCRPFSFSPLASEFLMGSSFGNLIFSALRPVSINGVFTSDLTLHVVIADVFTGREIVAPELPRNYSPWGNRGMLTAPLSSPDCHLIIFNDPLIVWRVGDAHWDIHFDLPPIHQLLLFKDRVYSYNRREGRFHTLSFSPRLAFEPLEQLGHPPHSPTILFQQLVECGDELLSISLDYCTDDNSKLKFSAFRLDFSHKVWVEVKDLGDWSLFVDARGCSSLSCVSSSGWGGRSNCIYFVGAHCLSWRVYPLDEVLDESTELEFVTGISFHPFWPVWVYPSVISKSWNYRSIWRTW